MPDGFSEVMLYIEEINRDTLRCSVKHVLNVRYQGIPFHASYQNHFMTVVFANGQLQYSALLYYVPRRVNQLSAKFGGK